MTNLVKKILFVAANPENTSRLKLDVEASAIQKGLDRSRASNQFELTTRWATEIEDLRRTLLDIQPHIIHFSGHGVGKGGLVLHASREGYKLASGEALADLIGLCADQAECVLLNACNSQEQAVAIHQHVDYVIGMSQPIDDRTAIEFSSGFYDALCAGKSYDLAYRIGCNAIAFENREQMFVPELMERKSSAPAAGSNSEYQHEVTIASLEDPNGPVPLLSTFYIERPPVETDCYRELERPGALIRLNAARKMGKSSLMSRITKHGQNQNYRCVSVNFQQADTEIFENSTHFLRWFCAVIAEELSLNISTDETIDTIWKSKSLANKIKCTKFFKTYLLQESEHPLVLCLDEVDLIFQYQKISRDFFSLLRTWYENGRSQQVWQKFRLVIAHSREVYPTLDMNESPFNVGTSVSLPEFSMEQVENLSRIQGANLSTKDLHSLTSMIGGHPYLMRVALYKLVREQLSLDQLISVAPTEEGPYEAHLRRHLTTVEADEELTKALKNIVNSKEPLVIDSNEAFRLASMGLIRRRRNAVEPLCSLYRQYFKERLQ